MFYVIGTFDFALFGALYQHTVFRVNPKKSSYTISNCSCYREMSRSRVDALVIIMYFAFRPLQVCLL